MRRVGQAIPAPAPTAADRIAAQEAAAAEKAAAEKAEAAKAAAAKPAAKGGKPASKTAK